ncbi:hypothetical protein L873DRAFT_1657054, partial [Choiromyces venosus 120613-1]
LDYCVEMLWQKVVCGADVGVIMYNWIAVRKRPYPDFCALHTRRDFEGVLEWAHRHQ